MQVLHNMHNNARVCIIGIIIGIKSYAEIMQKSCRNYANYANYANIMQKLCKLCRNYAEIMQILCRNFVNIMQNYAEIM